MIEMKISGIGIDPQTNMPVVLLKDKGEKVILPIWIGIFEASAIAMQLQEITPPRPATHDLIKNLLTSLDIKCEKIIINDIKDNTYYARLIMKKNNKIFEIDSRPSDALAIAVRVKVPIYVEEKILKAAVEVIKPLDEKEAKKIKEALKDIKPEDFLKYNM